MSEQRIVKLVACNEESKLNQLMDELRSVIAKPEYDRITVAALLGVLELLKAVYIENMR
jgi:hypothetical protein